MMWGDEGKAGRASNCVAPDRLPGAAKEGAMKYICLGYFNKDKMDARPKAEIDALMSQCQPYMDDLYKTGQVISDAGLKQESATVRTLNGKQKVTDGPFVETKEQIGGVFIIEAEDMNEAIRVASKHPGARMPQGDQFDWAVEIHPLSIFNEPPRNR